MVGSKIEISSTLVLEGMYAIMKKYDIEWLIDFSCTTLYVDVSAQEFTWYVHRWSNFLNYEYKVTKY